MSDHALDVPPGSWDRRDGIALIDPDVGARLLAEARRRREAKSAAERQVKEVDKVIRGIIGDGASLVTTDGLGLAVIVPGERIHLDRIALCAALGVPDLSGFEYAKPTAGTLQLAAAQERTAP